MLYDGNEESIVVSTGTAIDRLNAVHQNCGTHKWETVDAEDFDLICTECSTKIREIVNSMNAINYSYFSYKGSLDKFWLLLYYSRSSMKSCSEIMMNKALE